MNDYAHKDYKSKTPIEERIMLAIIAIIAFGETIADYLV